MNKKIAMSAISIVSSLAIMGGATFAAFLDQASLTANTFASGEADLRIAIIDPATNVDDSEYAPTQPGFGAGETLIPGYDEDFSFWLRNFSDDSVTLDVIARLATVTGDSEALQDAVQITFSCLREDAVATSAGPFSINQWEAGQALFVNLDGSSSPVSDEAACDMNVTLPLSADNTVAGKIVNFNVLFDGTQVAP